MPYSNRCRRGQSGLEGFSARDDNRPRDDKGLSQASIVLFHNAAKNTPAALPKILEKLIADGYKIVPVSELIYKENFSVDVSGKQIPNTVSTGSID